MLSGIDISHWQGTIDWIAIKNAGVQFAYAKATEGNGWKDGYFVANRQGAGSQKVPFGAYHFWRAAYSGESQADFFLATLGADLGQLPLVIDVEDSAAAKDPARNIANLQAMIDRLAGKKLMVYTAKWYWDPWFGGTSKFGHIPLWVAHYATVSNPLMPAGWLDWLIWQYTSSGRIAGIDGNVDLNRAKDGLFPLSPSPAPDVRGLLNDAKSKIDEAVKVLYPETD